MGEEIKYVLITYLVNTCDVFLFEKNREFENVSSIGFQRVFLKPFDSGKVCKKQIYELVQVMLFQFWPQRTQGSQKLFI